MLPIQMNEFVQRNFKDVGVDMELVPSDWNALLSRTIFAGRGNYSFIDDNADLDGYNISWAYIAPYQWPGFFQTNGGLNTQAYSNPEVDRLLKEAQTSFEPDEQDRILGQVNELVLDDAPYIFIVHDLNPRVLNSRVKGYVQDKSWFTNLQDLWIEE
jgi:peptide/nickel transport system substrate-binding protein